MTTTNSEGTPMSTWTDAELAQLDRDAEVRVAGRRADGSSRTLTIVWHVVVDGTCDP